MVFGVSATFFVEADDADDAVRLFHRGVVRVELVDGIRFASSTVTEVAEHEGFDSGEDSP